MQEQKMDKAEIQEYSNIHGSRGISLQMLQKMRLVLASISLLFFLFGVFLLDSTEFPFLFANWVSLFTPFALLGLYYSTESFLQNRAHAYASASLLIYEVTLSYSVLNAVLYWLMTREQPATPGEEVESEYRRTYVDLQHTFPLFLLAVEFGFNKVRVASEHYRKLLAFGLVYVIANCAYCTANEVVLYAFLRWDDPKAFVTIAKLGLFVCFIHFFFSYVSMLKIWSARPPKTKLIDKLPSDKEEESDELNDKGDDESSDGSETEMFNEAMRLAAEQKAEKKDKNAQSSSTRRKPANKKNFKEHETS